MLIAIIVLVVLVIFFGPALKNILGALFGLFWIVFIGAIGIALLGTAISFPPLLGAVVIFFIVRGLLSD